MALQSRSPLPPAGLGNFGRRDAAANEPPHPPAGSGAILSAPSGVARAPGAGVDPTANFRSGREGKAGSSQRSRRHLPAVPALPHSPRPPCALG